MTTTLTHHPWLPDDRQTTELCATLQAGYDELEDVNGRLRRLIDDYEDGRTGPGLSVTLADVGRTYGLLDDLRVQHAQTGYQIDKLAEHLSRLHVMRGNLELAAGGS